MAWWLQVILAIVLVVLGGFLVALLVQLRRTAVAMEALAHSAREDLGQIAADIHSIRGRAEGLADLVASGLELPISLGRIFAGAVHALEGILGKGGVAWVGPLLTGLKLALNFLRRPKKRAATKEATHE
jgi:hypothetical protein